MFTLVRQSLIARTDLYFVITTSQLKKALMAEGYTQEELGGKKKPELWKLFTGMDYPGAKKKGGGAIGELLRAI